MKGIVLLSTLMLVIISPLCGQRIVVGPDALEDNTDDIIIEGPSYLEELKDVDEYWQSISQLSLEDAEYILIYPIGNHFYSDNHWETLFKSTNTYRKLKIVLVMNHPYAFDLEEGYYQMKQDYLFIDKQNLYKEQSFYSYSPILYKLKDNKIDKKYLMSWGSAYPLKYKLWQSLKVN